MPVQVSSQAKFLLPVLAALTMACGRAHPDGYGSAQSPPKVKLVPAVETAKRAPPRVAAAPNHPEALPPAALASRPEAVPGAADLDPDNDFSVGPPDEIPDCASRLERANIEFKSAHLPLRQPRQGVFTCGTTQAIAYLRGPGKIRYNSAPVVSCGMALALGRFESVLQEEAQAVLGARVTRIVQLGTYSCRKMARFPSLVSEHSYANAIDIQTLELANGQRVSVRRHFGSLQGVPQQPQARFLRGLAHRLYDEGLFSVVLTPFFDKNHADHFHLDLARYRVDGTR